MRDDPIMCALGAMVLLYVIAAAIIILAFVGLVKVALFIISIPAFVWGYIRSTRK